MALVKFLVLVQDNAMLVGDGQNLLDSSRDLFLVFGLFL
jgi:hypothetical protein